jgi:hypothetical protein
MISPDRKYGWVRNVSLKDDQRQTEIVYVQVQVISYNNVHTSMINQNLDFKVRRMKGMTKETWTGQQNPKPLPL